MNGIGTVLVIALIIGAIVLTRLFGAWMLRIDEVIKELKGIRRDIRNSNARETK